MASRGVGEVPLAIRVQVIERDEHVCRLCGLYVEVPHLHHIEYRSAGGDNRVENLVSLDYGCHQIVHRNKGVWTPILKQVVRTSGTTGRQLLRWYRSAEAKRMATNV